MRSVQGQIQRMKLSEIVTVALLIGLVVIYFVYGGKYVVWQ